MTSRGKNTEKNTAKTAEKSAKKSGSTALRLKDFEKKIHVRPLTMDDYDALVEMQVACFPGMKTWKRDQIQSQVNHFPEGQLIVEYEGRLVASSSSLIVQFDQYSDWHEWREISADGYISNHDPEGDTLYGIEIMVHPKYRGLRLARRLYTARKELAKRLNVARIMIGGRIPNYHKYASEMSAREYCEEVIRRGLYDPVLTTQIANGFQLKRLIENYLPADKESCGYATFCEWTNFDYVPEPQRSLRAVSLVRICALQYQMRAIPDFEAFEAQCEFFLDAASEQHTDFVLFPELMTTQLLSFLPSKHPSDAVRALSGLTSQYLDFFARMAIKYNVNIISGSTFVEQEGRIYNISHLFRRDGTIEGQKKLHITPTERRWWGIDSGSGLRVFETDRGKIAILICYDVEFPELARVATAKGAQILFVPFNTDNREGYLRVRYCAQARAIENQIYVAISGCCGNLPFVDNADVHYAQSGIFTPLDFSFARDGVAAECTPNIEALVVHDVDLELLRRSRLKGTVQTWNDRRHDLYHVLWHDQKSGEDLKV